MRSHIRKLQTPWRRANEFPRGGFLEDEVGRRYVPASEACVSQREVCDGTQPFEILLCGRDAMFPQIDEMITLRDYLDNIVLLGSVRSCEYKGRGRTGFCLLQAEKPNQQ